MSNKLRKNVVFNYIGQFYIMTIGIVMLPFYLQYLGDEAYGMVGFFTALTALMMLLDIGLSFTLSRETARLKDNDSGNYELRLILRSVESVIIIITFVVFIGIFHMSGWISTDWLKFEVLNHSTVVDCVKLMGFMIAIRWFIGLYQGVVQGLEQQVWLNVYKIIFYTLKFVGALFLIIYVSNDIFHFFIYQSVISLIELLVLARKVYISIPYDRFLFPSIIALRKILPFASSVAYTSIVWAVYSQLDKLLLSHYIPLNEYGYFVLIVSVSGVVMKFSTPLSQAMLPRMTHLLSNDEEKEMLALYRKGTRFIASIVPPVVVMLALFSNELLYSWTGNIAAAEWGSSILFWYVLGTGFVAISSFQYYLQYAHGKLKYHVKFNTYLPLITVPIIFWSIKNYGAYGASLTWFSVHLVSFMLWTPFVHHKFAPGLHMIWLKKDILPPTIFTIIYLLIIKSLDLNFESFSRIETFTLLVLVGISSLILNWVLFLNKVNWKPLKLKERFEN